MKVYALRTCRGQWAVCSDEGKLLNFESYAEAVGTARAAVKLLSTSEKPTTTEPTVSAARGVLRLVHNKRLRRFVLSY